MYFEDKVTAAFNSNEKLVKNYELVRIFHENWYLDDHGLVVLVRDLNNGKYYESAIPLEYFTADADRAVLFLLRSFERRLISAVVD